MSVVIMVDDGEGTDEENKEKEAKMIGTSCELSTASEASARSVQTRF
jgi:hypothetical protein